MRRILFATLLVSAAAVAYELLLMRTLSIVQWHHFAYMIISLALLGYGASGTFIALFRERLESRFEAAFALSALLFSVTMVACYGLGLRVPFNALEVVWNPRQFLYLAALYATFFVPFFFAATCIGLALNCCRSAASRVYFFDLLGAGVGAVLVIGALFALLPQNALLLFMTLPLVASIVVGRRSPAQRHLGALQALWLVLLVTGLPQTQLGLRISDYKGLSQALQVVDSRILQTSTSPLGFLTVVDSPTVPVRHAPGLSFATRHVPPEQLAVFTDGDGMSTITRFDGNPDSVAYLSDLPAALPFAILDSPSVLVLGAGGGQDVLLALHHGAAHVDAVELNRQMTELVRDEYGDFAGNIYDDPRVSVHTREARGFVTRCQRRYDLVHIGLLDSFGASGTGVQSLNESYIYTVEAIADYLDLTEPGGLVAITRWLKLPPRDSLKLIATAIEALQRRGVDDPGAHLAVMRSWNTSTLVIRNGPFTSAELATLREFAKTRSFDMAWFPGMARSAANRYNVLETPILFDGATALLGEDAASFHERYKFHVEPATDDRPYFFHFFKWRTLPEVFALRHVGGAGLVEWGYVILIATLLQAIVAGVALVLAPLLLSKRDWHDGTGRTMGAYFLLLGLAFLFVEMAFIQKFIQFLSHPLYSVAVVLSSFLAFAGIGSALSARFAMRAEQSGRSPVTVAVLGIASLSVAYVFLLPVVFRELASLDDGVRILVSAGLIAPLAICMGMPFPFGLRRLTATAPSFIPWAWGINGFASVVSAVLATLLAIEFGFSFVIVAAVALYAAAAAVMSREWSG